MRSNQPLADRMRPKTMEEYIGQQHLVGEGAILRKMIDGGTTASFILWGPPGVGKTTLAYIIAKQLNRPFYSLSAINSGVKDIRETIESAKNNRFFNSPSPILFIDEIHRFSKSQQDSLLGAVEQGIITLIGATTENPSFEVISPLLSRCQVYILKSLEKNDLIKILHHALTKDEDLKRLPIEIREYEAILRLSGGDARKLLNVLELAINSDWDGITIPESPILLDNEKVLQKVQENIALYDKNGELHYDIISAFIKSIRGSDPNAAVYYLARMISGGEDPLFIARRLLILASEDIGLANANALLIASSCFNAVSQIGMPEGRIILSETAIYLANSPKSNASYLAIDQALELVKTTGDLPVPLHLRNAPTRLMKEIGYGENYQYAHTHEGHFVHEEYLPESISSTTLYKPQDNAREKEFLNRLHALWKGKYGY